MLPVSPDGASRLAPVDRSERILTVDVLRGLALLGVLIANMIWFSGIRFRFPAYRAVLESLSLDSVVYHAINFLVSGKAIATLSFLFGLGFSIQMLRARSQRVAALPLYFRRFAVLLLFGLLHTVFLWFGDILTLYAIYGFVLMLLVRRSDRVVGASAALLIVAVPIAVGIAATLMSLNSPPDAGATAGYAADNATTLEVLQNGSYVALIRENITQTLAAYVGLQALVQLQYLGLFLLGLLVGRHRLFEQAARYERAFRHLAVWGLGIGFAGGLVQLTIAILVGRRVAFTRPDLALLMNALTITTIVQAAGYVATVTLLMQRPFWRRGLSVFAPAGRMALTNYLTQTVVCLTIFYGFGGGLVGRTGPATCLLIALTIYATQMVFSVLWLSRFRMGPVEWVWRSATYGRLQPMVLETPPSLAPVAQA
jgi:uncharacterized protein